MYMDITIDKGTAKEKTEKKHLKTAKIWDIRTFLKEEKNLDYIRLI